MNLKTRFKRTHKGLVIGAMIAFIAFCFDSTCFLMFFSEISALKGFLFTLKFLIYPACYFLTIYVLFIIAAFKKWRWMIITTALLFYPLMYPILPHIFLIGSGIFGFKHYIMLLSTWCSFTFFEFNFILLIIFFIETIRKRDLRK